MNCRTVLNGFLAIATVLVTGSACSSEGPKLDFNGHELFYTNNVTEADAKKLGDYLVKVGLFKGDPLRAQLDKENAVYQVRLAIQPGHQDDMELRRALKLLAVEISVGAFDRAPTEIHACNDQLKACKVIPRD
jgi:hypothetical protein